MNESTQQNYLAELEAARFLGLKPGTLTVWRCRPPKGGAPAFYKIGRRIVYKLADLESWLAARRFQSTTQYNLAGTGGLMSTPQSVAPITCGWCRGLISTAWRDLRRDQSFGRCGGCGRVRELDGHEYGRFVLAECQSGNYDPMKQAGLMVSGGVQR